VAHVAFDTAHSPSHRQGAFSHPHHSLARSGPVGSPSSVACLSLILVNSRTTAAARWSGYCGRSRRCGRAALHQLGAAHARDAPRSGTFPVHGRAAGRLGTPHARARLDGAGGGRVTGAPALQRDAVGGRGGHQFQQKRFQRWAIRQVNVLRHHLAPHGSAGRHAGRSEAAPVRCMGGLRPCGVRLHGCAGEGSGCSVRAPLCAWRTTRQRAAAASAGASASPHLPWRRSRSAAAAHGTSTACRPEPRAPRARPPRRRGGPPAARQPGPE
jgi:hypothetical protein